ncbi:Ger(x)C family spore germination protein [Tumebacillus flagellatus]|uniref:Uncharacterized protein n=1 Tax=Tumebacillus flagellatus TaxID=1157490 RepID=A0A074M7B8_9BACL|nr:Ger(x)C family spore germination protein [Tumebacillus flagellatus]KEO81907.1 hypothetical protein EL26_18915 [Tumebacillus flagellatus]
MKQKARLALCLLLSAVLLTGCWDFREVEHVIYLNALGVDYVKGKYVLYAQVIDFTNLSKQEIGGGRHPEKAAIGKGIGDSFDEAAFNLYRTVQSKISWAHITALVFTERAVEANISMKAIDLMRRYHELRHTMWTFGTRESLADLFAVTPVMNLSILYSRLNSPEDPYKQSSDIRPMFLNQYIASIKERAETSLLPFLAISKERWKMGEESHPVLEINGVGVILNEKYQGFVDRAGLRGLRWVEPNHPRNAVFVHRNGKPFAAVVFLHPSSKIRPVVNGDQVQFDIEIKAKGSLLELMQVASLDAIQKAVREQLEHEVRDTYEVGLAQKSDILNLGLELFRKDPDTWHSLQKDAELPLTRSSLRKVDVQVEILSSGKLKM